MERVSVKSLNPQVTRELRIAEKRLRQRVATENLHELAAQQGIQIPDNAVAQASRVNMEFEHGMFGGKFMYTIDANDGKSVLCWDMVNDDKRVLSLEHVSVKPLAALEKHKRGLSSQTKIGNYTWIPTMWYVLEPMLISGDLFDAQRKRTKLLANVAKEAKLAFSSFDRAKLAQVDGEPRWSLRCDVPKKLQEEELFENDVVYSTVLMDGETFEFAYNSELWVLQQRVAARKIMQCAAGGGYFIADDTKPFLCKVDGVDVWIQYCVNNRGKDAFVLCEVIGGKTYMKSFGSFVFDYQYPAYDGVNGIKNDKAAQDLQKEGIQFDYEIGGLQFRAVCWTEFEEYVAPQLKSIGDEDDDD